MRPLTLLLCALALAVGTAVVVTLLTRSDAPPPDDDADDPFDDED